MPLVVLSLDAEVAFGNLRPAGVWWKKRSQLVAARIPLAERPKVLQSTMVRSLLLVGVRTGPSCRLFDVVEPDASGA